MRPPAPRGTPRRRDPDGAVVAVRSWPEGPVCSGCFATACETYGTCPGCGTHRLLPGRDTRGRPVCTDCAGGLGDFTCSRCGQEGWNHYRKVCGRCVLTDRLTDALTDDTGQVSPPLVPLLTYLAAMPRPRTGILWLTKPHTRRLLDELAHGRVPLTHHGMDQLSPPRAVAHLRHLLIAAGVLTPVDATLNRTTVWAADYLADLTSAEERRVLQRYDRGVLHRRLEHTARAGPLLPGRDTNHRYQLRQVHEFLTWARARPGGLDGLAQADLDAWATTATSGQRTAVRAFLAWTARTGLSPQVEVPLPLHQQVPPLGQAERIRWIRRAVHDPQVDPADAVVILLLLLYAQPVPTISRLKLTDLTLDHGGRLAINLGDPPAPVTAPFDRVFLDYLQHAVPVTTGNPHSLWLFPGRHATLPLHPNSLRLRLQHLGLAPAAARIGALRHLAAQAPPAIISQMLGYATTTTERRSKEAAATWARYTASRAQST